MKLSVWVSVSDLVQVKRTIIERFIDFFFKSFKKKLYGNEFIEETLYSFKKAGVDGIELLVPLLSSEKDIKHVKKIVDKNNIPVLSVHQSLTNINNISFGELERLCHIANIFSAKVIVLHSGALGEKLYNNFFINRLKMLQRKYKVNFGIENMPKTFFTSKKYTYEGAYFSSAINKMGLSMTFDTTHLAQVGDDIVEFYRANKKSIINIHLSDYKKHWLNRKFLLQNYTHLPLSKGELPIQKFLRVLKEEKYKGLITMEINANLKDLCESARIIKSS